MKIAILFKGPVRPNFEVCKENINILKNTFKEYELDDYAFTWYSDEAIQLANSKICKNVILLEEPNSEYIKNNLLKTRTPYGTSPENAYKHFWMLKFATEFIINTKINYEFLIYARLDTYFKIFNKESFFNSECYVSPQDYCDIIGSGTPENVKKAWDYKDLETLNKLYGSSTEPESCLRKIIEMNNVVYKPIIGQNLESHPNFENKVLEYYMNPNRK